MSPNVMHWMCCWIFACHVQSDVRTDAFLSSEYWDDVSPTENNGYSCKPHDPNKTKPFLNKPSCNTFFNSITPISMTMIDEYIMVHKNGYTNDNDSDLTNTDLVTY